MTAVGRRARMSSQHDEPTADRASGAPARRGPHRAPARAMLKAVGFTDEDLRKPLIGIANTWIEIGPCNYHLRDLAEHVREGIRAAGGTPMEFNTVSISDGITMGTPGMRMSLVSRELIADSIEMVVDGNQLDGVIALVGCDKTIPGAVMALARINVPGLVLYGGSIAPGHNGGTDVTIQDVFEAVGAHAAGRITTDELVRARGRGLSGRRRLRRPVHGQHDGGRLRVPRPLADGQPTTCRPLDAGQGRRRASRRRARRRSRPPRRHAAADSDAGGVRERHRVGRRDGRLDQRRAAPARHRARGRRRARPRDVQPHQRVGALAGRPQAGRPLRRDRPAPGRRQRRSSRSACSSSASLQRRRDHGHRPDASARKPPTASKPPGQQVVRPLDDAALARRAACAFCAARSRRRAAVMKVAGHTRHSHRGPARVFDSEEAAFAAVQCRRASSRATSSSSATKVRRAVPACARCSPSPAPSSAPASATASRSSPTAGSRARRTASWWATSRRKPPSGGPIARRRATATSITIDETTHRIDVEVPAGGTGRAPAAWTAPPPQRDARRAREVRAARVVGGAGSGDGVEADQVRS